MIDVARDLFTTPFLAVCGIALVALVTYLIIFDL